MTTGGIPSQKGSNASIIAMPRCHNYKAENLPMHRIAVNHQDEYEDVTRGLILIITFDLDDWDSVVSGSISHNDNVQHNIPTACGLSQYKTISSVAGITLYLTRGPQNLWNISHFDMAI